MSAMTSLSATQEHQRQLQLQAANRFIYPALSDTHAGCHHLLGFELIYMTSAQHGAEFTAKTGFPSSTQMCAAQ